MEISFDA